MAMTAGMNKLAMQLKRLSAEISDANEIEDTSDILQVALPTAQHEMSSAVESKNAILHNWSAVTPACLALTCGTAALLGGSALYASAAEAGQGRRLTKAEPKAVPKGEPMPAHNFKVCVCGGGGGIGQPLSLLMGMDPNVKELCVYDLDIAMVPPDGVAADLNHLERECAVKGYVLGLDDKPVDKLEECLTGCHLVLVSAGMLRKPGMTRDDLFKVNADITKNIVAACAKFCPEAVVCLIVNPLNSIVPAMAELYRKKGLDPLKIVGITTLDVTRANKFVGDITGKNPNDIRVPVVGGNAGTTILPLFSQDRVAKTIEADKIPDLEKKVQDAGAHVLHAKNGKEGATLSMAYAGARIGKSVLKGLLGKKRTECAYVASTIKGLPYCAQKVTFGEGGVVKVLPLGKLNEYETKRLEEVKTLLKSEIITGMKYAEENTL